MSRLYKQAAAFMMLAGLFFLGVTAASAGPASQDPSVVKTIAEPDAATACTWWPDLRDIWTPIGWRDHLFRFNVFYNGVILAQPDVNRRTTRWQGQGVQLTFLPMPEGTMRPGINIIRDDGTVRQGWRPGAAPVLWSEWSQDGLLFRQEVFAHVPGGHPIQTGIEPLFAWVRLSLVGLVEGLPLEKLGGFTIRINAPHISTDMAYLSNITLSPENSQYPRRLAAENSVSGWRLVEEDGRVRLGLAPGHKAAVSFEAGKPMPRDSTVSILTDLHLGKIGDVLVPILPTDRATFDAELARGFDGSLKESEAYWSQTPPTAAVVETPEPLVNDVLAQTLKLAQVIAERDPQTGHRAMLTGSFYYVNLWATPFAMSATMLLDALGYHEWVDSHLEMFRAEQGTVVPPGAAFKPHRGYLSTPKSLTAIDWLTDHGALLYSICEHGLLSGDGEFIRRWLPAVVKACDFIKDARAISGHPGVPGIMPPAVSTDQGIQTQAVWTDGWNYLGLRKAVALLRRAGHPRAAEFEAEAAAYREAWRRAFLAKNATMPIWHDTRGQEYRLAPVAVYGERPSDLKHLFYLDGGPLFQVFAGLMKAEEEPMRSALLWFREGPPTRVYRNTPAWQVPCLNHEISSCEPCYSWNIFHSHATGDRQKFLEGMYSIFAGGVSRQTFVSCETRGGITGLTCTAALGAWLARLAMVDDQIAPDELHLLRLVPLAWLRPDRETRFERMPTEFGPVTVKARLSQDLKQLQVTYEPRFWITPKRVSLHVPPVPGLTSITLNGRPLAWDGVSENLEVPRGRL